MMMLEKRLFAMCTNSDDVIVVVNFGRDNNVLVAVRGGGHNGGGLGLCDDGLVIDLSGIKYTEVNTTNNTVKVGGGSIWADVDQATHKYGWRLHSNLNEKVGQVAPGSCHFSLPLS